MSFEYYSWLLDFHNLLLSFCRCLHNLCQRRPAIRSTMVI